MENIRWWDCAGQISLPVRLQDQKHSGRSPRNAHSGVYLPSSGLSQACPLTSWISCRELGKRVDGEGARETLKMEQKMLGIKVCEGAGIVCPLYDRQIQTSELLYPLTATWLHPSPKLSILSPWSNGELLLHVLSLSMFFTGWGIQAVCYRKLKSVLMVLGTDLWGEVPGQKASLCRWTPETLP